MKELRVEKKKEVKNKTKENTKKKMGKKDWEEWSGVEWNEKVNKIRKDYFSYSKISITYLKYNTLSWHTWFLMLDARSAPALSEKVLSWRSNLRRAVSVVRAWMIKEGKRKMKKENWKGHKEKQKEDKKKEERKTRGMPYIKWWCVNLMSKCYNAAWQQSTSEHSTGSQSQ